MSNVQITHSTNHQGRTDVAVAVHPSAPQKLVTAAKHIPAMTSSQSHIDVHRSSDEGATWTLAKALLLPAGAAGAMSPSLAWDKAGNLFLAVAAWSSDKPGTGTGIHVYRSTDDGATWSEPKQVAVGKDFPSLAHDPRTGNVYL
ncbi:MAG TPA: sialidase family protein, partial [Polyangiaceae bacterium]|nr:sialidase family protein [Polyangiaceae bacterium]